MENNNPLKYSNCWEDANLLTLSLDIDSESKVMSIASAGDNSLMLLSAQPKSMLCLDMNEVQLWVTKLKEQAIRHLSHQEFLKLLGFISCENRWEIFLKIREFLSDDANVFLSRQLIESGLIHQGKFEKYFQLFAKRILPFIHSKKDIQQLMLPKSAEEQDAFYHHKWNNLRWKLLFRIFFSKYVMGKFGREPEKLNEVKLNVGKQIFNVAEAHLKSIYAQQNYILYYTLTGQFGDLLPPYAMLENFTKIKSWLQQNEITYFYGDLENCLMQNPGYNRFNLSNIFEYMSEEVFEKQAKLLHQNVMPQSRICYWNLMVPRNLHDIVHCVPLAVNAEVDRGFFYQKFHSYQRP